MSNQELSLEHRAMRNVFAQGDPHSAGVIQMLSTLYPAFAKRVFERNSEMRKLVMSGLNPMDIMMYPICGRCESIAAWDDMEKLGGRWVETCQCSADGCGARTKSPITFREWIKEELRHKKMEEVFGDLEDATDFLSAAMMRKAERELAAIMATVGPQKDQRMGIAMPDGSFHAVGKPKIEVGVGPLDEMDFDKIKKDAMEELENG